MSVFYLLAKRGIDAMRKFYVALVALLFLTVMISCKPAPQRHLNDFESFVTEVEENATIYTDEEWEQCDAEYSHHIDVLNQEKSQLTEEEQRAFNKLPVRYYKAKVKAKGHKAIDAIGEGLDYLEDKTGEFLISIDSLLRD